MYPGPIGAIVAPVFAGEENAKPLPHASRLCGSCKQVCPVDINTPRMLLDLRSDMTEAGQAEAEWSVGIKLWALGNSSPTLFSLDGKTAATAGRLLPSVSTSLPSPSSGWTTHRDVPEFAPKTFRNLCKARETV